MEINHPAKQLHRHAVPVGLILLLLLSISGIIMTTYPSGPASSSLSHGLVTRVIRVQPAPNGLAKVTVEKNQPTAHANFNDVGRAAQFTLSLQAAEPPRP